MLFVCCNSVEFYSFPSDINPTQIKPTIMDFRRVLFPVFIQSMVVPCLSLKSSAHSMLRKSCAIALVVNRNTANLPMLPFSSADLITFLSPARFCFCCSGEGEWQISHDPWFGEGRANASAAAADKRRTDMVSYELTVLILSTIIMKRRIVCCFITILTGFTSSKKVCLCSYLI